MNCRLLGLLLALLSSCSAWAVLLEPEKVSTAQANVSVLPQHFSIAGLNRDRQIRLYLPPHYQHSTKHYPVLYMHDGQNIFDDATAYAGEWGVDETLNLLSEQGWLDLIVVAIDNDGRHRMTEYSGWDNPRFGRAEGYEYTDFVRNVVKPYIDSHYRTLPEPAFTGIMGSSMGGLISHYAVFNQPDTFGRAGIFSPSYWYAEQVFEQTNSSALPADSRIMLLMGRQEGSEMVGNMLKMAQLLQQQGLEPQQLATKVVAGDHNEAFWRREFADAVLYLFNPAAFYLRRP
ncbi:alpha/beta hydrolase [Rheinheimera aquimaris]|uniref:alpha/beta hydrolase n=1 Tax=Rheinheimera aquimaris TaxID=412437 RepID=UPI003A98012D